MANLFRCVETVINNPGGAKVYYLGEGTSFNIPELLPDIDYTTLTGKNFIVGISGLKGGTTSQVASTSTNQNFQAKIADIGAISISYSQSSGLLTIIGGHQQTLQLLAYRQMATTITHKCFAYLVLGDIEDITTT